MQYYACSFWQVLGSLSILHLVTGILAAIKGRLLKTMTRKRRRCHKKSLKNELDKAHIYNTQLLGNVVLTDPFDADAVKEQNADYNNILNIDGDGVMGSIEIPSIKVYLPIYHGTDSTSLEKGAGHLENSSFPVGGRGTHAVISAHTGLPSAKKCLIILQR